VIKTGGAVYLIDAADTETEGTTLDTCAVHVIPNQQNQLSSGVSELHSRKLWRTSYAEQLLEVFGMEQSLAGLR
jgi:hypothetical protein